MPMHTAVSLFNLSDSFTSFALSLFSERYGWWVLVDMDNNVLYRDCAVVLYFYIALFIYLFICVSFSLD